MKATTTRAGTFRQSIKIRDHQLTADEPADQGGEDTGPSPQELLAASLASCTAITMEMYAQRKGWNIGDVEVAVLQVQRHEHGGVDAPVHVERRGLLGVEEDGAQPVRDLSARA